MWIGGIDVVMMNKLMIVIMVLTLTGQKVI